MQVRYIQDQEYVREVDQDAVPREGDRVMLLDKMCSVITVVWHFNDNKTGSTYVVVYLNDS